MRRVTGAAVLILAQSLVWPAFAEPVAPSDAPPPTRATPAPIAPVPAKPEAKPPASEAATAEPPAAVPAPSSTAQTPSDEAPEAEAAPANSEPDAAPASSAAAPADAQPPADAKKPAETPATAKAPAASAATPKPPAPDPVPAKKLFGAVKTAAPLAARAIGTYAKGCLAGAEHLPQDGPNWQAMRLSRNRTWGHPDLIKLLEKFASEVKQDGWPGLLVGDIAQPRGGPMLTGHASHQVGLDADIWFTPMPDHKLTDKERETLAATSMLANDNLSVDPKVWSESRVKIIKRVASYPKIERVLVHPAIKKALCDAAGTGTDRAWLKKVRPYWGHFYHFHIRIGCPANSKSCKSQPPVPGDDGCGKELQDWFKLLTRKPKPLPKPKEEIVKKPVKPRYTTMADLPSECRAVLAAGTTPAPAVASTAALPAKAKPAEAAKPAVKKSSHAKSPAAKKAANADTSKKP